MSVVFTDNKTKSASMGVLIRVDEGQPFVGYRDFPSDSYRIVKLSPNNAKGLWALSIRGADPHKYRGNALYATDTYSVHKSLSDCYDEYNRVTRTASEYVSKATSLLDFSKPFVTTGAFVPMSTEQPPVVGAEPIEGIGNLLDVLSLWRNGTIKDGLELIDAIKSKDAARIRAAAVKVATDLNFGADAEEINDIVAEVLAHDTAGIIYELGDGLMKFSVNHLGYEPKPHLALGAFDARTATTEQAKTWWSQNDQLVREGSKSRIVRFRFKRHPELLALLDGSADQKTINAISPETLDRIITFIKASIPILTAVSAFVPYLIPVVVILKLIVARYEANHPIIAGQAPSDDFGLSLNDLLN